MTRARPWLRSSPCSHIAGDPFELARVPCAGEFVRLAGELYCVGSVVHEVGGDVDAAVYLSRVEPLPELPSASQLALERDADEP